MADNKDILTEVDPRLQQVEADKEAALKENDALYSGMVAASDKYYDAQIQASKDWAKQQSQLQQERTDFAIQQVEQQKQQAEKDYTKEQSGAYVDWQKQSSQHGVNAERMADAGMTGSGYSESAKVSMYTAYQNRVATARQAFESAVVSYNNAMTEARLQNSSALAEIAFTALQQQLSYSLQGFQYKNQLLLEQADRKMQIQSTADSRYQSVLEIINQEKEQEDQYDLTVDKEPEEETVVDKEKAWASAIYNYVRESLGLPKKENTVSGSDAETSGDPIEFYANGNSADLVTQMARAIQNGAVFDEGSVLQLGYGPISGDRLAELVSQGKVTFQIKNGKISFYRNDKFMSNFIPFKEGKVDMK